MVVTQAPKLNFIEVTNGWDGDVVSTDTYYPVRLLLVFNGLYSYTYRQVIQSNQGLYLVFYLYASLLGSWWFDVVGRRHQRFANVHYKKALYCRDLSHSRVNHRVNSHSFRVLWVAVVVTNPNLLLPRSVCFNSTNYCNAKSSSNILLLVGMIN